MGKEGDKEKKEQDTNKREESRCKRDQRDLQKKWSFESGNMTGKKKKIGHNREIQKSKTGSNISVSELCLHSQCDGMISSALKLTDGKAPNRENQHTF